MLRPLPGLEKHRVRALEPMDDGESFIGGFGGSKGERGRHGATVQWVLSVPVRRIYDLFRHDEKSAFRDRQSCLLLIRTRRRRPGRSRVRGSRMCPARPEKPARLARLGHAGRSRTMSR